MKKINGLVSSPVFLNFLSLSLLQLTNYLLPLILIPFLLRVIGLEKFGILALSQAFNNYFIIITDYGFNLTATRDISKYINEKSRINIVFNSVLTSKFYLLFLGFLLNNCFVFVFYRSEFQLFMLGYLVVAGQTFLPSWFFQGYQDMKFMTYANLVSKVISTSLIFLFVRNPSDYFLVNLFYGIGGISAASVCFILIYKKYNIAFRFSNLEEVIQCLKDGFFVFLSNFSINVYMNSSILIASFFCNPIQIGYYSVAEKVFMVVRQFLSVFSQVIYPKVCALAMDKFETLGSFLFRSFLWAFVPIILGSMFLFVFSEQIVFLALGHGSKEVSSLIQIFSVVPIVVLFNIPFYQVMLAYDFKKTYSYIYISGSLLHIGLNVLLTSYFSYTGTAVSVILTEIYITCGLAISLHVIHPDHSIFNLFRIKSVN